MKGCRLKLYLLSSVLLFSFTAQAQNLHYIYIQTEDQKPFYIKIDGQTIPSSASGYIIIPRLTQGSYKSYIGFPKTELGELSVNFIISDADAGYLLKNDVDQGLYMVNLLTMKFVPTERQWPVSKNIVKSKEEFARILSEVVNDSSINEITTFAKPAEITVKSEDNKTVSIIPEVIVDNKVEITKLAQNKTSSGLSVTYTDNTDTVDVIPVKRPQVQAVKEEKIELLIVTKKEAVGKDIKFINMELRNPNQQLDSGAMKKEDFVINEKKNIAATFSDIGQKDSLVEMKVDAKKINAACKKTATETDFLNLRKKMAAEKTEVEMRSLAGKQFGNACFTTEQIKNLGVLFITEEERYKFYVSAYPSVLDTKNFATLESQLADSYYITRFKAMLNY